MWCWRNRWCRWLGGLALLAFVLLNGLAWRHAWTLTHYVVSSEPSPDAASLSLSERMQYLVTGAPVTRPENSRTPADAGFAYAVHTIALPAGESLEAWLLPHPQPRGTALLFHGYVGSKDDLFEPARVLHEQGYRAVLVDFRGSGGSSGATTTLGVREAEDVAHAVAYVREAWPGSRVVLYGTSMGSVAILRAIAHEGVQPDAIIIESPFDRMINAIRVRMPLVGVPPFPAAELLAFWGGVQHGFNAFAHNPATDAQVVQCPVLLLGGEADELAKPAQVQAVFAQVPGQHKQLVMVPQAGHELLIRHSPAVQQQVTTFLREVEARDEP
jgi:hypothetical protein